MSTLCLPSLNALRDLVYCLLALFPWRLLYLNSAPFFAVKSSLFRLACALCVTDPARDSSGTFSFHPARRILPRSLSPCSLFVVESISLGATAMVKKKITNNLADFDASAPSFPGRSSGSQRIVSNQCRQVAISDRWIDVTWRARSLAGAFLNSTSQKCNFGALRPISIRRRPQINETKKYRRLFFSAALLNGFSDYYK